MAEPSRRSWLHSSGNDASGPCTTTRVIHDTCRPLPDPCCPSASLQAKHCGAQAPLRREASRGVAVPSRGIRQGLANHTLLHTTIAFFVSGRRSPRNTAVSGQSRGTKRETHRQEYLPCRDRAGSKAAACDIDNGTTATQTGLMRVIRNTRWRRASACECSGENLVAGPQWLRKKDEVGLREEARIDTLK